MEKDFFAHIYQKDNELIYQLLRDHCIQTAEYASCAMRDNGFESTAYLAGILHDAGKYSDYYQDYLKAASAGEKVSRGSVNHTFAGVIYLLEKFHGMKKSYEAITSEVIAYAVGAHHGEFDCIDLQHKNGFEHRLSVNREEIQYSLALERYLEECITEQRIEELLSSAVCEVKSYFEKIKKEQAGNFYMGLLVRMILSAVISGDRRDTIEFMERITHRSNDIEQDFWKKQLVYLEEKLEKLPCDSAINRERERISNQCKEFAAYGNGIYKIAVPTGAGKTLSTLRYAVTLAEKEKKKRILFVIPLLSVMDQNSKVVREYIKDKEQIGEYHSNLIRSVDDGKEIQDAQLLEDFWGNPIIVATLYQLLMNLFSNKTSFIARMQALANSVIVIDEAQSIPFKMTYMFNLAANFLAYYFNTTIILSSATQPCFEEAKYSMRFTEPVNMIIKNENMKNIFRRTEVINCVSPERTAEEIADFANEVLAGVQSLLIICNTKKEAVDLYRQFEQMRYDTEYELFHLSTAMCMKHRQDMLQDIQDCLDSKHKMICVSTQLVEAGIDFSFEAVIRMLAGMDNLAQAAGRCNRSNDFHHICRVYLMKWKEEKLGPLQDIKTAQLCSYNFLESYKKNMEKFDSDLLSEESVKDYYTKLFQILGTEMDLAYPIRDAYGIQETLFDLLSTNKRASHIKEKEREYMLHQAFETAGKYFSVYDDNTVDIIVPYQKGEEVIANLYSSRAKNDFTYRKEQLQEAKPYCISVFEHQLGKMQDMGMLKIDEKECFITLNPQWYDADLGVIADNFMM